MITRKFIKASIIYTLAGSLPMASAIILLPFYVLYLPTEVYGALSLYLAFSIFVQIVVVFSFDSSTYIHYHDYKHDFQKLSSFISSAFVFMLLIGAVAGLAMVVLGDLIFKIVFDDSKISFYPFGLMSVATGIFQALFKVYSNILQSREKPVLFLRSNLLQFFLIAALTIIGLYYFPSSLWGPIGGRMLAGLVVSAWVLYKIFSEFGFHFNFPLLKSTFGFNVYAFIYQIQQWFINYFDRFIILFFMPLTSVGIYDFALKCLVAIEFLMNGLHNSFYPKVVSVISAQESKGTTPELNRYYYGLQAAVMLCIVLAILALPILLNLFPVKQGYLDALQYLPYIAITYLLKSTRLYFTVPYGILKYTKPLPLIALATTGLKFGLMVLLISRYGIYGVVTSAIVSAILEVWILTHVLKSRFTFKFNAFKILLAPLMLLTTVLILEPLFSDRYTLLVHAFYVLVTTVTLLWVYRNELKLIKIPGIAG